MIARMVRSLAMALASVLIVVGLAAVVASRLTWPDGRSQFVRGSIDPAALSELNQARAELDLARQRLDAFANDPRHMRAALLLQEAASITPLSPAERTRSSSLRLSNAQAEHATLEGELANEKRSLSAAADNAQENHRTALAAASDRWVQLPASDWPWYNRINPASLFLPGVVATAVGAGLMIGLLAARKTSAK